MANGAGNTRMMVEAPPVTPAPFGLFSAATVMDDPGATGEGNSGLRWALAGITWEPSYCGPAYATLGACQDAADLTAEDGIDAVEAVPFTAYHLFTCRLPGRDWTTGDDRAREALRLGEQRAAELAVAEAMARAEDAVDLTITAGEALPPQLALGLLERHLGANYGGTGVVHADPLVATLLGGLNTTERNGTALATKLGTRVAVGGGYVDLAAPTPDAADPLPATAPGTAWMYATGQVMVRRAAEADVIRTAAGSLATNEFAALALRPYVAAWECVTAAVLVDVTAS